MRVILPGWAGLEAAVDKRQKKTRLNTLKTQLSSVEASVHINIAYKCKQSKQQRDESSCSRQC